MKIIILISFLLFTSIFAWDYTLFVQVWPPSWIENQINFTNDYFTIHGLWPQYWNGSWPEFCNKSEHFNSSKVQPIYNNLTEYWTNFKDPRQFWEHEFTRHLKCYEDIYSDPYNLFWYGLYNRTNLNIYNSLLKNDIIPSNNVNYSTNLINNVINKNFNTKVIVTCTSKNILEEIRFCMTKYFQLFDCPVNEQKEACKSEYIWYNLATNK